tara:strand:+ start:67259 stop:68887 length:1629 start_codon:yes stop_codon:yes gene_type:complete
MINSNSQCDTIGLLPWHAAKLFGDQEALYFEGKRWNFKEFSKEVDVVAKGLLSLGIKPQDKVALWMVNRAEWLFLMYATAKIGAILVPLNTRYRSEDVAYAVKQSESIVWIVQAQSGPINFLDMVCKNLINVNNSEQGPRWKKFPNLSKVVIFNGPTKPNMMNWEKMLKNGKKISESTLNQRAHAVKEKDTFLIAYTSGTTGSPKGVMHCHKVIKNTADRINRLRITNDDVILNSLPMFHLYGYGEGAITSIISGAKQVLTETFNANENLTLIEQESVTIIHGFDTHYKDMMDKQLSNPRIISSLRLGTFPSGAPNSISIAHKAQKELVQTVSGWGMTETWAFATISNPEDTEEQRCQASGYPLPGIEIRIVNPEDGKDVEIGNQGELWVKSYMNMKGYFNKPLETQEVLTKDGWLRTGDTAIIRSDGHLQFLGRFKDMLKVGGENVSSLEIEAFLKGINGVDQVALVGLPDDRLHEVPVAIIVPVEKFEITIEDIQIYCRNRIASFKIPHYLICVDKLPMTPTGKVQKHILRELAIKRLKT